jgi:hypothetical protein
MVGLVYRFRERRKGKVKGSVRRVLVWWLSLGGFEFWVGVI